MSTQRPAITTLFYNWKSSVQQMMTVVHSYKLILCNNKEYIPDICDNAANSEKHFAKQMTPETKSSYYMIHFV